MGDRGCARKPAASGSQLDTHVDRIAAMGYTPSNICCIIHVPILVTEAMNTPAPKAALDKDKGTLRTKAWDVSKPLPIATTMQVSQRSGVPFHFCTVVGLCHFKHAALEYSLQSYKGRVAFVGVIR